MSQQPDSQDPNDEGLDSLLTHRQTITDTPVDEDAEHAPQDTGQPSPAGASSFKDRRNVTAQQLVGKPGCGRILCIRR